MNGWQSRKRNCQPFIVDPKLVKNQANIAIQQEYGKVDLLKISDYGLLICSKYFLTAS